MWPTLLSRTRLGCCCIVLKAVMVCKETINLKAVLSNSSTVDFNEILSNDYCS